MLHSCMFGGVQAFGLFSKLAGANNMVFFVYFFPPHAHRTQVRYERDCPEDDLLSNRVLGHQDLAAGG